jgi:bis(5'-nucleosidyl)-tetraphosphatase
MPIVGFGCSGWAFEGGWRNEVGVIVSAKRSAGLIIARRFGERWRFLALRAYRNWDFPKGLIEPGEQALETALREAQEETGLSGFQLRWGHDYRETEPYAAGKIARYYLAESATGEVRLPVSPHLGRPEHHEYRWVAYDDARRLLPPRLMPILEWAVNALRCPDRYPRCDATTD